ncbi:MAG TPA: STAS domain-containing protein [Thermotogota bacterium]|jgi:anti-sigma B factor antagonist|nr:STAS domain-containing protein [Thermotogota bacterium]NLH20210.1 STAS domain-containing protein [Thermotogaceae bacterium]OQC31602.1 MAG: putative anti-sigma factor antagonist [Thermotogota bacterium ADurb.Bin062]HNW46786.1 STAS domain-containing protein [Thermotogota bacterium]HNY82894.1 STAS domain-containing protein [Thermotogota bacterium]
MLKVNEENGWSIVHMQDELDMSNSNQFKEEVIRVLIENGKTHVALDFSSLEYIDSSGLGTVVSLHKRCKMNGGKLVIFGISQTLLKLFKLTSLDKALNLYEHKEAVFGSGKQ